MDTETAPDEVVPSAAEEKKKLPPKKGRWRRRLLITLAATPVLVLAMWIAVHKIPGFGPLVANTLRAVFGNEFVAWLEDTAYGVQDWLNQKTRKDEKAEAAWEVPSEVAPQPGPVESSKPDAPVEPPFTLANVGPMHESIAAKGEGVWVPMVDVRKPNDRTRLLKTFLHPDKNRSWSIIAIVAVDLSKVELVPMAGRYEPESKTPESKDYQRKAMIPAEHHDLLLAAFNGGYKQTHGEYGMKVDGIVLTPGRNLACTIAGYRDGRIAIRSWENAKDTQEDMVWFRQTPICMYEEGKPHPALDLPKMGWGASSVSGTTVIRRSAMGIDKEGKVLFIGIGDFLTGKTIATAMHHAGAHSVAQLDVNFSFPKFVTYDTNLKAVPLTKNFEFREDEYVGSRAQRDFFYLIRKQPSGS